MDSAEIVYTNEDGKTEKIRTGNPLPENEELTVESIEVDEQGEWVLVDVSNRSTGSEGGVMIPKGRIIRINEGAAQ